MSEKNHLYTPATPRIKGIQEQYRRARRFLRLALHCKGRTSRFNNLIAAVYPARAIVELMLQAAEEQELTNYSNKDAKYSRQDLEKKLVSDLPHYYLLEKIRIHDFHRFGVLAPHPKKREAFFGGPIKLVAKKGAASLRLTGSGPQVVCTGDSNVKMQRPLYIEDGRFFDEESGRLLSLEEVLTDYLEAAGNVLSKLKG